MGRVFSTHGSFKHLENLLKGAWYGDAYKRVSELANEGLMALMNATPKDTYETANSWTVNIEMDMNGSGTITWSNSKTTDDGTPIVILLQYGHATGNGGYVQGRDFINGALEKVFSRIEEAVWEVVTET